MSTLSLGLPESLHKSARALAKKEKVSINQLVTLALAEKVATLGTEEYLEKRAKRVSREKLPAILKKAPDVEPEESDNL